MLPHSNQFDLMQHYQCVNPSCGFQISSSSVYHAPYLFSSSAEERRRVLFEGQLYPVYSVVRRKPRSAIKINIVGAGRTEQGRAQFSQQNTC